VTHKCTTESWGRRRSRCETQKNMGSPGRDDRGSSGGMGRPGVNEKSPPTRSIKNGNESTAKKKATMGKNSRKRQNPPKDSGKSVCRGRRCSRSKHGERPSYRETLSTIQKGETPGVKVKPQNGHDKRLNNKTNRGPGPTGRLKRKCGLGRHP